MKKVIVKDDRAFYLNELTERGETPPPSRATVELIEVPSPAVKEQTRQEQGG